MVWARRVEAPVSGLSRDCACEPIFPTAFTPDGDGANDTFSPIAVPECACADVYRCGHCATPCPTETSGCGLSRKGTLCCCAGQPPPQPRFLVKRLFFNGHHTGQKSLSLRASSHCSAFRLSRGSTFCSKMRCTSGRCVFSTPASARVWQAAFLKPARAFSAFSFRWEACSLVCLSNSQTRQAGWALNSEIRQEVLHSSLIPPPFPAKKPLPLRRKKHVLHDFASNPSAILRLLCLQRA